MADDFDLSEFYEIFYEECSENLSILERGLLELKDDAGSDELNQIFRAAHSIKGGAATFGYQRVSQFTHSLENLLGALRDGRLSITQNVVDALLEAFDVLKCLIDDINGDSVTDQHTQPVIDKLSAMIEEVAPATSQNVVSHQADALEAQSQGIENIATKDLSVEPTIASDYLDVESLVEEDITSLDLDDLTSEHEDQDDTVHVDEFIRMANQNEVAEPTLSSTPTSRESVEQSVALDGSSPENPSTDFDVTSEALGSTDQDWDFSDNQDESYDIESMKLGSVELNDLFTSTDEPYQPLAETYMVSDQASESKATVEVSALTLDPKAAAEPSSHISEQEVQSLAQVVVGVVDKMLIENQTVEPNFKEPTPSFVSETKSTVKATGEGSIRVKIEKVDQLINLVGELVITQSMLSQLSDQYSDDIPMPLRAGIEQLQRNSREIQEGIMQVRMLPISFSFARFPRLVRDLSRKLNKKVELLVEGDSTELDKTVLDAIGDPLIHLIRNAIDHGIESPEIRKAAFKKETGKINLSASHQGGNVVIEISDDGAGICPKRLWAKAVERGIVDATEELDETEVLDLIFRPGFSTSDEISDISGRGVGMDVVQRNIRELGGTVRIRSVYGQGTRFRVQLPLTLAIIDGQLVRLGDAIYILPLLSIIETIPIDGAQVQDLSGNGSYMFYFRDEYVPIVELRDLFKTKSSKRKNEAESGLIVVVESFGQRVGLKVDELLSQQQVVIKSLESNLYSVPGLTGATILGDGTVALIIDVPGVVVQLEREIQRVKGVASCA